MKITAIAPANIAFIKYWGKRDAALRLPANASFSMNLSESYTTTTVDFSDQYREDEVIFLDDTITGSERKRITSHLDRIRDIAKISTRAKVVTKNSFPKGTGVASSASGFAALTVAASNAAGLSLSERELTILARIGSGSACRSIPDGFVVWDKGISSDSSTAHSIARPDYWDLRDVLCIVDTSMKKITTSEGHESVESSPLWKSRLESVDVRMSRILEAFEKKDFNRFGETLEEDSDSMHTVMQTQTPPLYYWRETTVMVMKAVRQWRVDGLAVYYTIDAGPNVHVLCESHSENLVKKKLSELTGIERIISNAPAKGAHIVTDHLF